MVPKNPLPRRSELPTEVFEELAHKLVEHIDYAASQKVTTSISLQNGFHFKSNVAEHEVVDLGEQKETFAASHSKLAVVAFKLVQGTSDKNEYRDILRMLQYSDNGAFIRQKKDIAPEVVDFAKSEIGIETDILTIRDNGSSFAGQTTARDSLKLFLRTVQIARNNPELSDEVCRALSDNTSKYGVRGKYTPHTGLHLMNKTGDFTDYEDPEVGEAVHHDVGIIYTSGKFRRRLAYSITSSADTRVSAWNANRLNKLAGATLIEAVGGKSKSVLGAVVSKIVSKNI